MKPKITGEELFEESLGGDNMVECPICSVEIEMLKGMERNELIECKDCGTDLEVTSINPFMLEEAPIEEEDWGE